MRGWGLLTLALLLSFTQVALASRYAQVDVDSLEILAGPSRTFPVLETLKRGAPLTASNLPLEGYFKVRTASGVLGWVHAEQIKLLEPGEAPPPLLPETPAFATAPAPIDPKTGLEVQEAYDLFKIKLYGGLGGVSMAGLKQLLGFSTFGYGPQWGAQFHYAHTPRIGLFVRSEIIFKGITIQDSTVSAGAVFTLDASTIPVFVGCEYALYSHRKFEWSTSAALGLGFAARMQSNYLSSTEVNNSTQFSSTAYGGLLKSDVEWRFHEKIGLFAEGGYRFLVTSDQTPSSAGDGAQLYKLAGQYVPFRLDFSGLFGSLGFSFRL